MLPSRSTSRLRRGLLCLPWLAALAPRLAWAQNGKAPGLPAPSEWAYDVSGNAKGIPYRAKATLNWKHDGQRYETTMLLRATFLGSRAQTSQGTLSTQGLRPETFVDRARKERRLDMDWPKGSYTSNPSGAVLPLPAGAQDRLSLFFQLAFLLAGQKTPPAPGQSWSLPVLSPAQAQPWTFVWRGGETIDTGAGKLTAWKLEREARHPGDTRMTLWLAPEMHHMPVRILLVEEDGDTVDQRLSHR